MSAPALEITGVRKRFGAVRVLEGVQMHARGGEVHAVLGENGAGKSTLMRILAGVVRADAGQVALDGRGVALGSPAAATRAGIRTVFQELSSIAQLSVAENLLYGQEPRTMGLLRRRRMIAQARALLERFGLQRIAVEQPVAGLGLADRQLLEVVKALRDPARVLILDEATSALSKADSEWVLAHGRAAAQAGAIVLLITHRLQEVRAVADRITILRGGVAVLEGPSAELDDDTVIAAMLGRRIERLFPPREAPAERCALTVRGLRADGLPGPIDLEVRSGEVLGIGGLQGQGQRELLMSLAGAAPWREGQAELAGRPYAPRSPLGALSQGVAYVPEDRQREGLFLAHSVKSNITASSLGRFARGWLLDRGAELRAAAAGAREVAIDGGRLGARVNTLSGGNQQKVVLAKALLNSPKLLLLHDCTRGVDVGTKAEIFELVARLAASGTAVLFYSSDLSELVNLCDRVAVLVEGRIAGVVERDQRSEEAILRLALGHSASKAALS